MVCVGVIGTWRQDSNLLSNGELEFFFKLVQIPNFDSEIEGRRQRGRFLIKSQHFVRRAFDTEKQDPASRTADVGTGPLSPGHGDRELVTNLITITITNHRRIYLRA